MPEFFWTNVSVAVLFVRRWRRRPSPALLLQIRKIATFCRWWDRNTHNCPQMRKSDKAWESVVVWQRFWQNYPQVSANIGWWMDCRWWPVAFSHLAAGGGGGLATSQLVDKLQSSLSYAPSGVPLTPLCCLCLENMASKTTQQLCCPHKLHSMRPRSNICITLWNDQLQALQYGILITGPNPAFSADLPW